MAIRFGVVVFPGSNCDHDAYYVAKHHLQAETRFIWHKDATLGDVDVVILPGGFSYGDYLRSGAIARFSPVMQAVQDFAQADGLVIGICNGFQVLCESGLLPGVLMRNASLRFACKPVHLRVERTDTPFTNVMTEGDVIEVPIAHGEGNYFADAATLDRLEANNQIVFRYTTKSGREKPEANPNGSQRNIAGIINERGNVLGMMPHPERHADPLLGSTDGLLVFHSLLKHFVAAQV